MSPKLKQTGELEIEKRKPGDILRYRQKNLTYKALSAALAWWHSTPRNFLRHEPEWLEEACAALKAEGGLMQHQGKTLLEAAKAVILSWETGDLAAAVRELAEVVRREEAPR